MSSQTRSGLHRLATTLLITVLCVFAPTAYFVHQLGKPSAQPMQSQVDAEVEAKIRRQFDESKTVLAVLPALNSALDGNLGEAQQRLDKAERHWKEWNDEARLYYLVLRLAVVVERLKTEHDLDSVRSLRDEIELVATTLQAFLISMDDETMSGLKWSTRLAVELHAARLYAEDYPKARPPNFEDLSHR